jgi:hypothetical protein
MVSIAGSLLENVDVIGDPVAILLRGHAAVFGAAAAANAAIGGDRAPAAVPADGTVPAALAPAAGISLGFAFAYFHVVNLSLPAVAPQC